MIRMTWEKFWPLPVAKSVTACPKCGEEDLARRYCSPSHIARLPNAPELGGDEMSCVSNVSPYEWGHKECQMIPEHLRVSCGTCRYEWWEACADAEEDHDTLPEVDAETVRDQLFRSLTLYIATETVHTRCLVCGADGPEPCDVECPVWLAQLLAEKLREPGSSNEKGAF